MKNSNRKICFRAWDKRNKKWLLGYEDLGGFDLFGECMVLGEWARIVDEFMFERNGHKQDDLEVMQGTGLRDKKDNLIYESDIIKDQNGDLREIVWDDNGFWCKYPDGRPYMPIKEKREIVGNVWEKI